MKKLIAIALVLVMCLSVLPMAALAAESTMLPVSARCAAASGTAATLQT